MSRPPGTVPSETERRTALVAQLLERYGVLTREAVHAEGLAGGFAAVYDVLKAMEERGRVRRGYFVAGLGATQFALPGAEERLRQLRERTEDSRTLLLAATDPANPYGAALPWPGATGEASEASSSATRPQRAAGAQVVLRDGALLAWIPRTERNLLTFLPEPEPERSQAAVALARLLAQLVDSGRRRAVLVSQVNGQPAAQSFLGRFLLEAGFTAGSRGLLKRRPLAEDTWRPHA